MIERMFSYGVFIIARTFAFVKSLAKICSHKNPPAKAEGALVSDYFFLLRKAGTPRSSFSIAGASLAPVACTCWGAVPKAG